MVQFYLPIVCVCCFYFRPFYCSLWSRSLGWHQASADSIRMKQKCSTSRKKKNVMEAVADKQKAVCWWWWVTTHNKNIDVLKTLLIHPFHSDDIYEYIVHIYEYRLWSCLLHKQIPFEQTHANNIIWLWINEKIEKKISNIKIWAHGVNKWSICSVRSLWSYTGVNAHMYKLLAVRCWNEMKNNIMELNEMMEAD